MLEKFAGTKPRENAGSRSANRFDYQQSWSLCELLRLHTSSNDYLMVFDFHEDVVVFNSEINPTESSFYQIKTKSNPWTTKSLVAKGKSNNSSIVEKLLSSYDTFQDDVSALFFVSNQPFSVGMLGEEGTCKAEKVRFCELNEKHKRIIGDALFPEDSATCDSIAVSKLIFLTCELTPSNHRDLTKGRLVTFFDEQHPDQKVDVSLAYKTFSDEIERRTGYEGDCNNISDIKKSKSLCKKQFDGFIDVLLSHRSRNELWTDINTSLLSEGCTTIQINKIRSSWRSLLTDQMDPNNTPSERYRLAVANEVANQINAGFDGKMLDLASNVHSKMDGTFSEYYTAAIVIMEIIADVSLPKTYSKPTDKVQ